jgi:hypothetical protein
MPMYDVAVEVTCWGYVTVEADNMDDACAEASGGVDLSDLQNFTFHADQRNCRLLSDEEAATRV